MAPQWETALGRKDDSAAITAVTKSGSKLLAIEDFKISWRIDCLVQEDKVGLYSSINAKIKRALME